jgi:DNA adenine methylase
MGFLQAAMTLPGKKGDPPMGKKSEKRAARVAAAIARRKAAGTNPLEFTFTKDGPETFNISGERRRLVPEAETEPELQDDEKPEPIPAPDPDARGAREHAAWKQANRLDPMPPGLFAHLSFQGGKWNVGKTLAQMIEAHRERPEQTYIEPFVGGANVLWHISGKRIASDAHELMIDLWQAVQNGWYPEPAKPTLEQYNVLKARYQHERSFSRLSLEERAQIAWAGYAASDRGAWFNGYAHVNGGAGTKNFDKQIPALQDVKFWHADYTAYSRRKGCLIFCDPPYIGTKEYAAVGKFNHAKFWDWASRVARRENTVLVSEATLPDDRYIEDFERYMAGPHGDRQEYLIRVKASRPRAVRKI